MEFDAWRITPCYEEGKTGWERRDTVPLLFACSLAMAMPTLKMAFRNHVFARIASVGACSFPFVATQSGVWIVGVPFQSV